ncbi:motile sperm domain-containing protein 2-like isoform X1 [Mytilus californianus]|uniref:motile sperm domain-containing protein 2-like isoform X1 n=1 Tax=Mytilus californianus TaxID=6549 RepID=UPI0022455F53|nr:motile sperm domain-containing protein 2-like isoform X1 [Mytilus californianus]
MADGDKAIENEADKLREAFHAKYSVSDFVEKKLYDQRDIDNIKSNDLYVQQFIRKTEPLSEAADRLHEALKWRRECGIRDATEESFPRWALERGAIYFHNVDKDGKKLLFVRVKEHKKDASVLPEVKRFFAYHLETQYNEDPHSQITLVFDMADAGLSNLDMDLIKFVITSFKVYYPSLLNVMLIYEMPWLFNAAWKIIKTWLSAEAVKKIKFITRSDAQAYINKDQLLEHMGGTDKFQFRYLSPEERLEEENKANRKKVTFADQDKSPVEPFPDNLNNSAPTKQQSSPNKSSFKSPHQRRTEDNSFIGRLLTISPGDELLFTTDETGKETFDVISLKNTLPYAIAYKVKTTSPEKYRVRPSAGIVKAGSTVDVHVYLQQGYNTVSKDKFLIMAMELTSDSADNLQQLWKTVPRENIMEHRLKCSQVHKNGSQDSIASSASSLDQIDKLNTKMDQLMESNRKLEQTVKMMFIVQISFLILILLYYVMLYFFSPSLPPPAPKGNISDYCAGSNLF